MPSEALPLAMTALIALTLSAVPASAEQNSAAAFEDAYERYLERIEANDFAGAEPHAARAAALAPEVFGHDHPNTARLVYNHGVALLRSDAAGAAVPVLEEAVRLHEASMGEDAIDLIDPLVDLGRAQAHSTRDPTPLQAFDRAIELAREHLGEHDETVGRINLLVGQELILQGEGELARHAEGYLNAAREIYADGQGDAREPLGVSEFWLGRYHIGMERLDEAEELLTMALERFDGEDERYPSMTHMLLVDVYDGLGHAEKATAHARTAGELTPWDPEAEPQPLIEHPPDYPSAARAVNQTGTAVIELTIDDAGFVEDPELIASEGHEAFGAAAMAVIEDWRFLPAHLGAEGTGEEVRVTYRMEFTEQMMARRPR